VPPAWCGRQREIALANLAYNTRRLVWIDGRNRPRLTPPCGSARFPPVERDAKSRGGPSASRRAGPTSIAPPNRLLKIPYGCNQSRLQPVEFCRDLPQF
jgi:hypothetical protein